MELIKIPTIEDGVAPLLDRLVEELGTGRHVLWLVSGGSNIGLSVSVMREIPDELTNNLTIYLTDERYGDIGHADSNAFQLEQAGFDPKNARQVNVLARGLSLEETAEQYALSIAAAFEASDIVIAQLGMGPDGHILGVLPGSPAVNSDKIIDGYDSDPFTRVTLTLGGLQEHVDAAYTFAFGEGKRQALDNLLTKDLDYAKQPAQALKRLPECYVYNDLLAGELPE